MVMSVEGSWGVRPGPVNDDLRSKLAWDDEKQWKLIEREKRTFLWIKILSLPAPMFVVVKMSKLSKKWPRKYLLNVTVHGSSKAFKLGECTFVTIFFRILLNFVKNILFRLYMADYPTCPNLSQLVPTHPNLSQLVPTKQYLSTKVNSSI